MASMMLAATPAPERRRGSMSSGLTASGAARHGRKDDYRVPAGNPRCQVIQVLDVLVVDVDFDEALDLVALEQRVAQGRIPGHERLEGLTDGTAVDFDFSHTASLL